MSINFDTDRQRWRVRWWETDASAAAGSSAKRKPLPSSSVLSRSRRPRNNRCPDVPAGGNKIYAYDTKEGVRYRVVFRQSDGTQSNRRGFTSRRAAATARRRLVEAIECGEAKASREIFRDFWARVLEERRPYLTAGGSMVDYETHGRKTLLPALGSRSRREARLQGFRVSGDRTVEPATARPPAPTDLVLRCYSVRLSGVRVRARVSVALSLAPGIGPRDTGRATRA